ncbi:RHS repeat-associated core domain-containing protein [Burkholderia diffusa]|nr:MULTISPECIES: RHS repeat-associated core domain-containing protein [Burkholderia]MDN7907951.1 RHS repeat-associated core domain-containing protein [Burkholderia diffusa]
MHYNRNRYYDPNSGRFVSKDPIGYAGGITYGSTRRIRYSGSIHWGCQDTTFLPIPPGRTLRREGRMSM